MNGQIDDRRMEDYLRSFKPLLPAPLPQPKRQWNLALLSAAAALVTGLLLLPQFRPAMSESVAANPNTIGGANHLLANSLSWKEAIDEAGFAFHASPPNASPIGRGALELLSQKDLSK
jgi:hypothetical protein